MTIDKSPYKKTPETLLLKTDDYTRRAFAGWDIEAFEEDIARQNIHFFMEMIKK